MLSDELLPRDILSIMKLPCDCVLLSAELLMNDASLIGIILYLFYYINFFKHILKI